MIRTVASKPWAAGKAPLDHGLASFARDVHDYLLMEPRQLPSRYLYDELGSALFEAICRLPWYRITRAERRLLSKCGPALFRRIEPVTTIVELGSGSGEKLRALLETAELNVGRLSIHLVDLSHSALEAADHTLTSLGGLSVTQHEARYEAGLAEAATAFDSAGPVLVLFLGSNIGNFDPPGANALLRQIRDELRPGDALLLGADLVKPEGELQLAYDDPLGVTAAFNRNLLVRVNRELGGDFDIDRYAHRAVWDEETSRVEMHLVAQSDQHIRIPSAQIEIDIKAGEFIWTESSYKYRPDDIDRLLDDNGFRVTTHWIDHADGFALTLAEAV